MDRGARFSTCAHVYEACVRVCAQNFTKIVLVVGYPLMKISLTSWANARVKLHSQVHFETKKFLGPKKSWDQKKFNSKKIVGPVIS